MLKGVNRQVVDITQPDSIYFERVIFFVKPEFCEMSERRLKANARELIDAATPPPFEKVKSRKNEKLRQLLRFLLVAIAGAATSAAGFMIFL